MRIIRIIFYLILVLTGVSFAVLNAKPVSVNFYFTVLNMPVSLLMTFTLAFGVMLGALVCVSKYWRLKMEHRKIKSQLKLTEKEVKNLRSIPIANEH